MRKTALLLLTILIGFGTAGCSKTDKIEDIENSTNNDVIVDDGSQDKDVVYTPEPTPTPGPEVKDGIYELNFVRHFEGSDMISVAFDKPGANNGLDMEITAEQLGEFELGDIVTVRYTEENVCPDRENVNKCMIEYNLVSIEEAEGLYTEAYTLSQIIDMEPIEVAITKSGSDMVVLYNQSEDINKFIKKLDNLTVYKDCVELYGAGADVYTMRFLDAEGNVVIVKDSYNVEIEFSDESNIFGVNEVLLGFHRTADDQSQYSTVLAGLFE